MFWAAAVPLYLIMASACYLYIESGHDHKTKEVVINKDAAVYEVFNKILRETRFTNDDIQVVIIEDDYYNAFAGEDSEGKRYVKINRGYLDYVNNNIDGLAAVIGHELAHHSLLHVEYYQYNRDSKNRERAADLLGFRLMTKAGYDRCYGYSHYLIRYLKNIWEDRYVEYWTHPTDFERASYHKKLCLGELR